MTLDNLGTISSAHYRDIIREVLSLVSNGSSRVYDPIRESNLYLLIPQSIKNLVIRGHSAVFPLVGARKLSLILPSRAIRLYKANRVLNN